MDIIDGGNELDCSCTKYNSQFSKIMSLNNNFLKGIAFEWNLWLIGHIIFLQ